MKILVKAKPNSKTNQVMPPQLDLIGEKEVPEYTVSVKGKAKEGEANEQIWKLLSDYFKIPKSRIRLISGYKSKTKVFEIGED